MNPASRCYEQSGRGRAWRSYAVQGEWHTVALVSILAQDRVGFVSEIADHLFEAGVNLGDTSFAVLGTGAELTAVCELPAG